MCLNIVYRGRKKEKVLAEIPDMVICWKVVQRQGNQHRSLYLSEFDFSGSYLPFLIGWNKTIPLPFSSFSNGYDIAFHAFLKKENAEYWTFGVKSLHVVKCKTKKEDIVAIGRQGNSLCIVTKRIWIPKPKKKPA